MNLTDSRLAQAGNERLELAMLSFFEQFRKIYIGDQVQKSSKVNTSLMTLLLESVHHVKSSVHSQLGAKLVGVFSIVNTVMMIAVSIETHSLHLLLLMFLLFYN